MPLTLEEKEALPEEVKNEIIEVTRAGDLEDIEVCKYDEAMEIAGDYIKETLWAFRPEYLVDYMPKDVSPDMLASLQNKHSEDLNPMLLALVGSKLDELIEDAICDDGLGHFLNSYDGDCHELSDNLICWRVN
jgi:hypothetical protein